MSDWATAFLGVIAAATLATAIIQIAVIIVAGRTARRIERVADLLEREVTPLVGHLNAIGRDAARAASLATTQVERVDQLFADVLKRADESVRSVQSMVSGPLRDGAAVLAASRAIFGLVRDLRANRSRSRAEDEDALFI